MSEMLRSVMAETAAAAAAGRRPAPFAGCAHGVLGAAMAVAEPPARQARMVRMPVLLPGGRADVVLPPIPDQPVVLIGRRAAAERRIDVRKRAA